MLKAFFATLTGGQVLLLALSVAALLTVLTLAFVPDRITQLLITAVVALALLLGGRAATSAEAHRMRTARYSVYIFGGVLLALVAASSNIDPLIRRVLEWFWPPFAGWTSGGLRTLPMALLLVAIVAMFALVMWFLRSPPALGSAPTKDPYIKEPKYIDRRAAFLSVLKSRLETIDEELRWHHEDFVELRAEVDVRNAGRLGRRVTDLVQAIKQNRDADIFVVLGVPGAGKSVALRKACMDLLRTQRATERIPIYVNLKEWLSPRRWTAETPPTDAEFSSFVRSNVRGRLPDRSVAFFDEHFDRLVDAGEIFFLFDSFDEIPGVLDADETSKLLDSVSAVVVRYLRSQNRGRGVIASRYYRRPRLGQEKHVQLDVRPFSERQIAKVVSQSSSRSEKLTHMLFKERPDLGALAKNPFSLSLILLHWERGMGPPSNQSELFASYINRSLDDANEITAELGLSHEELRFAMAEISWAMFESDKRGLEMTVREISKALSRSDIDEIVDALVAARLVRKAPRTQAVSFVHRRFNEYFLVARWLSGERVPPFDAIPTDSRFRDALVLYAEVASESAATQLAEYCWREVEAFEPRGAGDPTLTMRSIYCLRFLTEAFRVRQAPIATFQAQLGDRIRAIVSHTDDILVRKIAVEGVGLLDIHAAEAVLLSALSTKNRWIADSAFTACRYLPQVPSSLELQLFHAITLREQIWLLLPDRDFMFVTRLADAFVNLRRRVSAFRYDMWISVLVGIATLLLAITLDLSTGSFLTLLALLVANALPLLLYLMNFHMRPRPHLIAKLFDRFSGFVRPDLSVGRFATQNFSVSEVAIGTVRAFPIAFLYALEIALQVGSSAMANNAVLRVASGLSVILGTVPFATIILWASVRAPSQLSRLFSRVRTWLGRGFKACWCDVVRVTRGIFPFVGSLVSFAVGAALVTAAGWWLLSLYKTAVLVLVVLLSGAIALVLVAAIANAVRPRWRDHRKLAAAQSCFNASRQAIGETFNSFETDAARLQYVRWLEHEAETPESLAALADVAVNVWPNGRRPNNRESEASTLLAQLDARWMKIDI